MTRIELLCDGEEHSFSMAEGDLSILDAGLADGLDLPHSCRAGACASCVARMLSGSVTLQQNEILTPEEIESGLILTCQAIPRSALVMLSYDGLEDR